MHNAMQSPLKIRASYHQERLWFIDTFETGNIYESSPVYHNIPLIVEITGTPAIHLLEQSIKTVIQRHEALRTRMTVEEDRLYQQVEPGLELKIPIVDLGAGDARKKPGQDPLTSAIHEASQPFSLTGEPLTRAVLIKVSSDRSILVITLHHIIADRYSLKTIYHELVSIYRDLSKGTPTPLEEVPLHYADFSTWQREISPDALEAMRFYWNRQLAGLKPLDLPTDKPRAPIHIYREGRIPFQFSSEGSNRIKEFCRQKGTGNDALLLAGFNVLLSRYCGQEDIVVGIPIDNRHQPGTEGIVGPVANLLVIRTGIPKTSLFPAYFSHLSQTLEQAYENRDIPFDWMAEQLNPGKDMSRTVFFDVLFQYDGEPPREISLGSLTFNYIETNLGWGKYDLNLLLRDNGETLTGILVYNAEYYEESTAARFVSHYKVLLDNILENPHRQISCLPLLPPGEKQRLLNEWNQNTVNYPKDRTIIEIFETQVESAPDRTALLGEKLLNSNYKQSGALRADVDAIGRMAAPDDGADIPVRPVSLTYHELNEQSDRLAGLLIEKGVKSDVIVGIMVERSIEMIIGILGILKAGGAYLPIDPEYPGERIRYMLADSGAKLFVTIGAVPEPVGAVRELPLQSGHCPVPILDFVQAVRGEIGVQKLETGQNTSTGTGQCPVPTHSPATSLAYIIYTSGTTGRPKGVMIDHRSLMGLFFHEGFPFDFNGRDVWTMFHSLCFDFSVWEIWGALLYGGKLLVVPKISARDTSQFAFLLRTHRVTVLNQTPSAFYNLITQELAAKEPAMSLRYVIFGGEALNPGKLNKWMERYPQVRLINMYGITETTVHVTYKEITDREIRENLGNIGKPLAALTAYVLDEQQEFQPLGVHGELYIAGIGVARGYLNRPVLTAERFMDNPHKPGERLYRSGDLARRLENHEMIYAGRVDQQVQLRGFRIELGEIENRLLACPGVEEAVVLDRQDESGDLYLCAYIVGDKAPGSAETRQMLGRALPEYMIPAYVVKIDAIPLTPNGKVDRQALPAPGAGSTAAEYVPPQDPVQQKLADLWAEVLNIETQHIGIDTSFFEMGGHSLKATIMTARVHQQFQVKIPLAQVFMTPTIRGLSGFIRTTGKKSYISIEPVEEKEYYPLAPAQKRLYVLHQLASASTYYNMPQVIEPGETLDKEKLEKAFKKMIARHDSLRTSFETVKEEPVQRVHRQVDFSLDLGEIAEEEIGNMAANFAQPFDLSKAPLLRVNLLKVGKARQVLLLDMHHIISDGTSQEISGKEFAAFYGGQIEDLPPLKLQYKDYSQWLNRREQVELRKQQGEYWQKEFGTGELPVLNLPTDFPRPLLQSFEGNWVDFAVGKQETRILNDLARENDATIYMALLAVFNVLMAKLSGQEDIVIGTPIAARRHSDLQQIIGMLVNTLPLRNYPAAGKPFDAFLKEVKQRTLEAYENQEYPFEELVEHIDVQRDTSRNPLFDILLNLVNLSENRGESPRRPPAAKPPYRHEKMTSRFDLTFSGSEVEGGQDIYFTLEYSTRLFRPGTIERYIGYLKQIILSLPGNTGQKIQEIDYISLGEKQTILEYGNGVKENPAPALTIDRVFQEKVKETADHTALVYENQHLAYGALNGRANRLARLLKEKGIGPDMPVGVMKERSLDLVIALLAVVKAGGAYVPIDPEYPGQRVLAILEDSRSSLLLAGGHLLGQSRYTALKSMGSAAPAENPPGPSTGRTAAQGFEILPIDELWPNPLGKYPGQDLETIHQPGNLFYVIYTSGSTGKPKGVMLEHRNLLNLIHYQYNRTNIDFTRVLQFTTIGFDVSAQEIFSTLLAGGRLVLVDKEVLTDLPLLFGIVKGEHLRTLFLPASFLKFVINEEEYVKLIPTTLMHIVSAGEQLIVNERFKKYLRDHRVYLHNHYGPSETHVVTALTLDPGGEIPGIPSIGRAIANTMIYILDRGLCLVPLGVSGELIIAGRQLGRGYLNNPELTAEKFKIKNHKLKIKKGRGALRPDLNAPHLPIYMTGDLARWLPDGNIEFLGRIDHQVKIRGFRVEMGEIESQLMNIPGIKAAVVQARTSDTGERYLCAYIAVKKDHETTISVLREYLSKQLPEYMIPAYFVQMDELPLTPNRKIDRRRLPEPSLKQGGEHIAPRNEIEEKVAQIWAEIMGLDKNIISIDSNFFELGGHSLRATVMIAKINKKLKVKLPLAEVFNTPTIRGLSEYINGLTQHKFLSITPTEKKEYYRLSSAQKRLYILKDMDDQGINYNLPYAAILEGNADKRKLEDTFKSLIERHESLRTSFHMIADEPVQRIHKYDEVGFEIEYYELEMPDTSYSISDVDPENNIHHSLFNIGRFVRTFNLAQAPLLRVCMLHYPAVCRPHPTQKEKVNPGHILIIDMHHIISDGVSIGLLVREFMLLYGGEKLQELSLQYKDFSEWQSSQEMKETIKKQEEYWLNEFGGEIPVLNLPIDFKRPIIQSFEGGTLNFEIDMEDTGALKKYAIKEKTTLFTILLAAYTIFLSKISNQEDIVVGTPVAGRQHSDMEQIVGMFVNMLPLRNYPAGEKTIHQFTAEVKERTLEAFANQDYQYENLVDKRVRTRDAGRNPLFDTMFSWQNFDVPEIAIPGLNLKPYIFESGITRFDLILRSIEIKDRLGCTFNYSKKLFNLCTVERLIGHFKKVISAVIESLAEKISNIEIISEAEKTQILKVFNDTGVEYPREKTIQQLFEEQVEKTPDHIAVAAMENDSWREGAGVRIQYLTYIEMKTRTNQLALILKSKGIGAGSIVTIMTDPFINMIIGILAVTKAGGCYLPLDPRNPEERITYILKDSETGLLLTRAGLLRRISIRVEVLYIDNESLYKKTGENLPNNICRPGDPIYMIYTSGTTGKPKGVIIKHENLVNYVTWFSRKTGLTGEDRTVLTSSFAYDLGYTSLYSSVLGGGQLHLLPGEIYMQSEIFWDYIHRHRITYIKVTPSFFNMMVANPDFSNKTCEMLRLVVLGGEAINVEDVEKMHYICPHIKVMNHYGPTEVTIGSIAKFIDFDRFDEYKARPTIGRPISNTKAFILDKYFKLLPVGIAGELCLSGAGVAKGYFKRDPLNSERFISNAFMEEGAAIKPYDRVYRTGDLARWMPDGNIEFLGRIDSQVKIRGFRIELGEIESQLLNHPGIKEAVVITRATPNQDNHLCAYINSNKKITAPELREYLSKRLPDYMVPSYFVFLESIPLTPNGKVDRKALPDPGWKAGDEYRAPRNEMEKRLVEIWSKVLEIPGDIIGIESNFFGLGGHSLKATIFITQVNRELNIRLPLTEVFKTPTIKQLAEYIRNESREGLSSTDDYLVLLKRKSPKAKHLFFIHDGSGEVEAYMEFCNQLDIEFNCWGIRADVIKNYTPHKASIEEIAGKYLEKIKKVQPQGPYYIAGWSLGGTIAFEIVSQLEIMGENIDFLAMIDSPSPQENWGEEPKQFNLEAEIKWMWKHLPDEEIKEKVRNLNDVKEIWPIIMDHLVENHYSVEIIKRLIPAQLGQIIPNYNQLEIKELIYYMNLNRTLTNARRFFIPSRKIHTTLHYFKASQSLVAQDSWDDYCMKPLKSFEITGDHFSIFKAPNVVRSAQIIAQVLHRCYNCISRD